MTVDSDKELDGQIAEWRAYVHRRRELHHTDAEELEDHLRSRITELTEAGLRADEAFLIAVKRMGSLDELSREFAREHSERLWKQLVLPGEPDVPRRPFPSRAACHGALCGRRGARDQGAELVRAGHFRGRCRLLRTKPEPFRAAGAGRLLRLATPASVFASSGCSRCCSFSARSPRTPIRWPRTRRSVVLTAIHLPLALWLVVGVAYMGGDWRSDRRRMDFIRFTGEWLIYFVLIGLGGGVLIAFTIGTFDAIGLDAEEFIDSWLLPCGAMAAVIVAAWLVEAKQSVIENMAPVLTRVFTPLFAVTLLAFLVAVIWTNNGIDVERDVLILFDLLLVVVLGLLLYAISARDPAARPGLFDRLQFALVVSALIIDVMVLLAITGRITEWGFSPNKTAALGENVILLTNLAWSAWLFLGFLRGRMPFARLERWQTRYLIVYAVWAWTVVLAFPLVFDFA